MNKNKKERKKERKKEKKTLAPCEKLARLARVDGPE